MTTNNVAEWEPIQPYSQALSPLPPFVVGRKTLVYKTVNHFALLKIKYTSAQLIGHVTEMLFKFKMLHKEENKLPQNAKIQDTAPLVSLRFGA